MSMFPKAKPSKGKRQPKRRRQVARCVFVASGSTDYRGVAICATCDELETSQRHDVPETPEAAREIDERRLGESTVDT